MKRSIAVPLWGSLLAVSVAIAGGALRDKRGWLFLAWLTPGVPPPGPFG